ncbi:hypothetical protein PaecuDRAFT_3104 [Paenibacillus curdlanolyticus YK9]|uniref:Uncharacterized protein n=1 Tax=Paenibacillus curdlanolyticus YK9 TaxID=717606 RepID=E0IBR5_9BACL|nr:hypothetical protein [Paenibacillus curdlanolyticus]EFM10145.1 hypothetical protein PaecuDRAFT_3104 [Paenibacillus curdlanolyticus YK9]
MKALNKLRMEMDAAQGNAYVQVIGKFLIDHLEATPSHAEQLCAADKSIVKSLDAMKAEAKKKQSGGVAMLTDAEGFAVVLKYYGIDADPTMPLSQKVTVAPADTVTQVSPTSEFDVKLDDFL